MVRRLAERVRGFLNRPVTQRLDDVVPVTRPGTADQQLLRLAYQSLVREGAALPPLSDVGFKVYSQNEEDGILWFLFSVLGTTNQVSVEICAADGVQCNSANLILNHGWRGLLFDGSDDNIARGREFYARAGHPYPGATFVSAWITRENINVLISEAGFAGDIDLLILDLDGVDYWILEALNVVRPRVVVVEYQDILGPDRSVTVPYSPSFSAFDHPMTSDFRPNYAGASLRAFVSLARSRGYRLVGTNRNEFNAFFVLDELAEGTLPELSVEDAFSPQFARDRAERFESVRALEWVEV